MIKVIEKDLLDDEFINKKLITNISKEEKIYFSKDNIYYFGNYTKEGLNIIKQKLLKNKNALKRAIENNIKFIISVTNLLIKIKYLIILSISMS